MCFAIRERQNQCCYKTADYSLIQCFHWIHSAALVHCPRFVFSPGFVFVAPSCPSGGETPIYTRRDKHLQANVNRQQMQIDIKQQMTLWYISALAQYLQERLSLRSYH